MLGDSVQVMGEQTETFGYFLSPNVVEVFLGISADCCLESSHGVLANLLPLRELDTAAMSGSPGNTPPAHTVPWLPAYEGLSLSRLDVCRLNFEKLSSCGQILCLISEYPL